MPSPGAIIPPATAQSPVKPHRAASWLAAGRARFALYVLAIAALIAHWNGAFPLDDAYIVLHNARVLLSGGIDPIYGSSPLTGSTSPVHLLLVAVVGLLVPLPVASLPIASLVVGLAGTLAYTIGLDVLVRKMGAVGWRVPLLVMAGLFGGIVPLQLLNGLETSLAAATVAWLLVLSDDRRLAFLAGLAPFVRPELGLLSALLMGRRWFAMRSTGAPSIWRDVLAGGLVALPFAAWMLFATGHLLPQTAYAKSLFFAEGDWTPAMRLLSLSYSLASSGLLPLAIGLAATSRREWAGAVFVVALLVIGAATIPSAMGWNHCRYLAPLTPIFLVGLARMPTGRFGGSVTLLSAGASLLWLPTTITALSEEQAYWKREEVQIQMMTGKLPPGAVVLVHDAGLAAWTARDLHLVDVVGLKTPDSVEQHRRFTRHRCAFGPALERIARDSGATFALVLPADPWVCVARNLAGEGWRLARIPGPSRYQLFALTPPAIRAERR